MRKWFLVVSFYTKKDLYNVLMPIWEALYRLIEIFHEIDRQ